MAGGATLTNYVELGETVTAAEPERELIRKLMPFAVAAVPVTFLLGSIVGWRVGASAAIGAAIVAVYFVATAVSLAWAAKISPVIVFAVGLGGFVLRLIIFASLLVILRGFEWFSIKAFIAAFVPWTAALLIAEMKLLAGRMQAELWSFPSAGARP